MQSKFEDKPLVTISCITYNHANYIVECLEGFLNQKTNFPIEIVIHDDASSDGTSEIIEEYASKFPSMIFPIIQKENQFSKGIKPTWEFNAPRWRGKYIALCEGDDYWTDPYKLQKQVDFLEANPDYSICFHPVQVLKDGVFEKARIEHIPATSTITDLSHDNYINTCSVVFRSVHLDKLPSQILSSPAGDYLLHLSNARYGKIMKLDDTMAVYRVHGGGVWSTKNEKELEKSMILLLRFIKDVFENESEVRGILGERIRHYETKITDRKLSNKIKHKVKLTLQKLFKL